MASVPLRGMAQESMLAGLGWHKNSAGTQVDGSQVQVQGNRSTAQVTSTGGKGSVLANVGMQVDLAGTAQAQVAGLAGMEVRQSQVQVLANQVSGFVNALGGAATANVVLAASGTGTQPLHASQLLVHGNRASDVAAFGAKSDVLLGTGSLQLPGRATANSILLDGTAVRRSRVMVVDNDARGVTSIGGSALANAFTAARGSLTDSEIVQTGNEARDVRAGGGAAGVGRGTIAQVELTGVAAANAVSLASSDIQRTRVLQAGNRASNVAATGGSALANSVNFSEHRSAGEGQYTATVADNTANGVQAWGGEGSILMGALADVRVSATALANTISVTRGAMSSSPAHSVAANTAEGVVATGGGAVANSLWLDDATIKGGTVAVVGNTAEQVRTAGAQGTIGGGIVGGFERNGRALANALVVDRQASLDQAGVVLAGNRARDVTGSGGLAGANALLVSEGRVQGTAVSVVGNSAEGVQSTGYEVQAGGGVLFSASQPSTALANAIAVTGSQLDAAQLALVGNTASRLDARGGTVVANGVALEHGAGRASRLSAPGALVGNTATGLMTEAGSASAAGGLASRDAKARAAANALVLHDGALVDDASSWSIVGNSANTVQARGGTALVNALAAYRGARVLESQVLLAGNVAEGIRAEGGSSQAMGVGSASNGVLSANAVYMDGGDAATLLRRGTVVIAGNQARELYAQGGRINANALSVNAQGGVEDSSLTLAGNVASDVRSEGREGTVAGFAAFGKGVGQANANAIQVLSRMREASVQLVGNMAGQVHATDGLASANSFVQSGSGSTEGSELLIAANTAEQVRADGEGTALANSVQMDGSLRASTVQVTANQGGAQAGSTDAMANSVRVRGGGSIGGAAVTVAGNQGSARHGVANSVDVEGSLQGGSITILGNQGRADGGGAINSVVGSGSTGGSQVAILGNTGAASGGTANSVRNGSGISGAGITILGNQARIQGDGQVNSLINSGSIRGSQVLIAGNTGQANGGGLVNSVRNAGSMTGAHIVMTGNQGSATRGGTVNSVDNRGVLTGRIVIAGNRGSSTMGGTVNSVVNQGVLSGNVVIAGNQGRAALGGVANSLINRGVVTGSVTIVGNATSAGAGMTSGSVRNMGAVTGAAGVAGNGAFAANPGYTYTVPSSGVVNQSVTVLPGVNLVSM